MKRSNTVRKIICSTIWLLPAMTALLLYLLLPGHPEFTEKVFSRGISLVISVPLGFITSWIPFSVTELLAVLALPAAVLFLVLFIRKAIKSPGRRINIIAHAGRVICWILSVAALLYMLLYGVNFNRRTASELLELETASRDVQLLYELCTELAVRATEEREAVSTDADGYMILKNGRDASLRCAGSGYTALEDEYPFLRGSVSRAKPVRLSYWWSYTGISGMYFPMLCEANVNVSQPDSAIPATAAHELAHTRGFAREDECNFWACISCFEHPSADYRYSGYLLAFIYCGNELYDIDKELYRSAREKCSDGVNMDLTQRSEYWKQFEGPVREVSENVNNTHIQSHGVSDGVRSYDRVVELLASYYESGKLF